MKKYIIYIGILVVGLILGRYLFGSLSTKENIHNHETTESSLEHWTCSMHPQIDLPEFGDCPICGMDLIPLNENGIGLTTDQFKLSKNAMALANIQTSVVGSSVTEGNIIKLSGNITENEDETATQPAHFNGRIEKLYVKSLGEKVKMGQAIAQIYSPEIIAAQQELITAYKIKESQPLLYQAVRNKFKNWKIQGSQLAKIETTGQVETAFTIYSHVSGVITEILANEGAHIMDGHPIFKVANLNTVWANFDVYENQLNLFKKGQDILVSTNAYPNKKFNAKVSFIDPVLNSNTRTVKLRVVLDNKNDMYKPGMFVEGNIGGIISDKIQVLIIPSTAILWTGERSVVYIKIQGVDPVFEMREVRLGNRIGESYEVISGISNGDEIVTNGTFTVDAAAQLQGKKSMMNKRRE